MFIAMNRFKINLGFEEGFEKNLERKRVPFGRGSRVSILCSFERGHLRRPYPLCIAYHLGVKRCLCGMDRVRLF